MKKKKLYLLLNKISDLILILAIFFSLLILIYAIYRIYSPIYRINAETILLKSSNNYYFYIFIGLFLSILFFTVLKLKLHKIKILISIMLIFVFISTYLIELFLEFSTLNNFQIDGGKGWVVVQSKNLDIKEIINSLKNGKFYSSTGVEIAEIILNKNSIEIKINQEEDITYDVNFIGTLKKDMPILNSQKMNHDNLNLLKNNNQIGKVLLSTKKNPAFYNISGDEMYVRAHIISNKIVNKGYRKYEFEQAWTQPFLLPIQKSENINGPWFKGNLHTQCNHLQSGDKITTDAPVENHGSGAAFSPTDLAVTALGSCLLTIMGITAKTHEINMDNSIARVTKIMSKNPRRIGKIIVEIDIPNKLSPKDKRLINRAAKSCPVHHSLHPDIETEININSTS